MNDNEFLRQQQAAVQRMREMNDRAHSQYNPNHKMPPVPSFVKTPESNNRNYNQQSTVQRPQNPQKNTSDNFIPNPSPSFSTPNKPNKTHLNIPFLDILGSDADASLIIGLLLILMSENTDKILLFALVYILL